MRVRSNFQGTAGIHVEPIHSMLSSRRRSVPLFSSSRRTFLLFLWRHKGGGAAAAVDSNVWHYQTSYCTALHWTASTASAASSSEAEEAIIFQNQYRIELSCYCCSYCCGTLLGSWYHYDDDDDVGFHGLNGLGGCEPRPFAARRPLLPVNS